MNITDLGYKQHSSVNSLVKIKVIGLGGGGGNAVDNMFTAGVTGVDFLVCNTDAQALAEKAIPNKLTLGPKLTKGEGCGGDPERGRLAAEESLEDLKALLSDGTRMVFITAGMGGGTGTGSAPVVARLCRELGILTVGIVTLPFIGEGTPRKNKAKEGVELLRQHVDSLLVVNNASLSKIMPKNASMRDAFRTANEVLLDAARSLADLVNQTGYINVDFADVSSIMKDSGSAIMGIGIKSGENRHILAVDEAISSPLLENVNLMGARGVIVNIAAPIDSIAYSEFEEVMEHTTQILGEESNVFLGMTDDPNLGDQLKITIFVCGFNQNQSSIKKTLVDLEADRKGSGLHQSPLSSGRQGGSEGGLVGESPAKPQLGAKPGLPPQPTPASSREDTGTTTYFNLQNQEAGLPLNGKAPLAGSEAPRLNEARVVQPVYTPESEVKRQRVALLRTFDLDPYNQRDFQKIESEPAFLRMGGSTEDLETPLSQRPERASFYFDRNENRMKPRENNAFWSDMPD
jgi:cell division protein FtsZ